MATDSDDKARKAKAADLYQRGKKAAARGDKLAGKGKKKDARSFYGTAAGLFLEAYRTVDNPLLLYVLGQVYQSRTELTWAKHCYERYLEREPEGQKVSAAREKIAAVEAALEARKDSSDEMVGSALDAVVDPAGVCYEPVVVVVTPPPAPPPPERVDRSSSKTGYKIGFFASAGVTAGSAAVALVTLLQISEFESDKNDAVLAYQAGPGNAPLDASDVCTDAAGRLDSGAVDANLQAVVTACDSGKSRAAISNIMQGVSVVALLATGFFIYKAYIQKSGKEKNSGRALIAPSVTRHSVGAHMLLRF